MSRRHGADHRAYNDAYSQFGFKFSFDSMHRFVTNAIDMETMVKTYGFRGEGTAFCARE